MLGMTEREIFYKIDDSCASTPRRSKNIPDQKVLQPEDITGRIATAVAKAIAANNKVIEWQLRRAGLRL